MLQAYHQFIQMVNLDLMLDYFENFTQNLSLFKPWNEVFYQYFRYLYEKIKRINLISNNELTFLKF